jgi:glutamate-ammonia-ligase adenylyltransferase
MESSLVVRLSAGLPERIARRIELLLASVPDPDAVQRYLERLQQEAPSAFDRIVSSPAALRCAVNVFAYSRFLADAVLKKPERILEVSNSGSFYRALSVEGYEERLFDFLGKERRDMPSALDLARFRRRQLLRIALRDVMGVSALAEVTEELSNLADAILDFTVWLHNTASRACPMAASVVFP